MDAVLEVQLMLYITMGERTSRGVPHVRLIEVELAGSTITGEGYAAKVEQSMLLELVQLLVILAIYSHISSKISGSFFY